MSDYWQRRQAQIMYEGMEDAEKTAKEIADLYAKATREINYQIGEIFDRFVDKHDLSEEEAKRLQEERKQQAAQKQTLKQKQKAAQEAKAAKAAKAGKSTTEAGRVGDRPYARGRSYKADRYDD